jgi:hypothetical protein
VAYWKGARTGKLRGKDDKAVDRLKLVFTSYLNQDLLKADFSAMFEASGEDII